MRQGGRQRSPRFIVFARRSLKEHALAILQPLQIGDLDQAHRKLARIVSRETQESDEAEVIRGTLEAVGENSSDGLLAPPFSFALGGVPLALAYKAFNTLDSMLLSERTV